MDETHRSSRAFAVGPTGEVQELHSMQERLDHMDVPGPVSAAYDILTDDGLSPQHAADMAFAMHRQADKLGKTAEAQARHFVSLRRSLREDT